MKITEYLKYDGLGLAQLVKDKQITPLELVEVAIKSVEKTNPKINAVTSMQFEKAKKRACEKLEGPFAGVPFLLKDMGAFEKGEPSTFGSYFCKDFVAGENSVVVDRFKSAGFINIGRTNAPEFGLMPTTEPKLKGATLNPWNLKHTPGGSSGGSAAAVAAGNVPLAHGGDGGGSIRIPASCCGLFGLKPSEGRSPVGPRGGRLWHGLAVEHVLTRSVRDSASVLDFLSAKQIGAPIHAPDVHRPFLEQMHDKPRKLKIGYIETPFSQATLHEDCRKAALKTARLCEKLGHHVEAHALNINPKEVSSAYCVVVAGETAALLERMTHFLKRKPKPNEIETVSYFCALGGQTFRAADYAHAVYVMDETRREVAHAFDGYDAIITPALALPPPKIGELLPNILEKSLLKMLQKVPVKPLVKYFFQKVPESGFRLAPYTFLFNLTGQPAMSVPLHWNADGLPIGTQIVAKLGEEGLLFNLARQLEEEKSFMGKVSPLARGLA